MRVQVESNGVPDSLQKKLDAFADRITDRKTEIVDLLSNEQPTKSRQVEMSYTRCTWWEGCYYCQDEQKRWHRVKCFI